MAVTNLDGGEQAITDFVQGIIKTAQQKVEEEDGVGRKMPEVICRLHSESSSPEAIKDHALQPTELDEVNENIPREPTVALAPIVQGEDTEVGFEDNTEPFECKQNDPPLSDAASPDVTERIENEIIEEDIRVLLPNGESQTIADYVRDIIVAARQRAEVEAKNNPQTGSHKNGKRHRSGSKDKSERRNSRRSGAVRELISRFFRRGESEDGTFPTGQTPTANRIEENGDESDKQNKIDTPSDNKNSKRPKFRKLWFPKKQKYKVSTEALPTDDHNGDKVRKRQKVGRTNSFGKSLRNILSCSSSVTTV